MLEGSSNLRRVRAEPVIALPQAGSAVRNRGCLLSSRPTSTGRSSAPLSESPEHWRLRHPARSHNAGIGLASMFHVKPLGSCSRIWARSLPHVWGWSAPTRARSEARRRPASARRLAPTGLRVLDPLCVHISVEHGKLSLCVQRRHGAAGGAVDVRSWPGRARLGDWTRPGPPVSAAEHGRRRGLASSARTNRRAGRRNVVVPTSFHVKRRGLCVQRLSGVIPCGRWALGPAPGEGGLMLDAEASPALVAGARPRRPACQRC